MVIGPVVGSAAVAAVDDEGLINKAFKIAMLIGLLALAAISIIILSFVIEIANIVEAGFNLISLTATAFTILPGPIGVLATAATAIFSAFGFGGRS
jgi:hypothetical protein